MKIPGYEQLADVLQAAFKQASEGKGAERHANDLPFHEQRMLSISELLDNDAGMAYQVCKKIAESRGMKHDARERELLGAIVYTAGMVIFHRKQKFAEILSAEPCCDGRGCPACNPASNDRFDEARMDTIGQNGNDGEHYTEVKEPGRPRHLCGACGGGHALHLCQSGRKE